MKYHLYHNILLFIFFSALFINPNASPSCSSDVGSSGSTKASLPILKDSILSTMELIQNMISALSEIHSDRNHDDPYLKFVVQHCANFLSEAANVLNWIQSSIHHAETSSDVMSRATILLQASLGSQETFLKVIKNDTTSHSKITRSMKEVTASINQIIDMLQVSHSSSHDAHFCKASSGPKLNDSFGENIVKQPRAPNVTVAQDGSGKFKTIMEAIKAAPNGSGARFVILVKKGVYKEYVMIERTKTNILMMGEGKTATVISGSKSAAAGQETFYSATFAVYAQGFIAIDIGFENTAGPAAGQAVALLSFADRMAFHRCRFSGHQDTLLVASGRQFFRECEIRGTVDFVFGYGTAVFSKCNIYIIKNTKTGTSVAFANGRNSSDASGFVFTGCTINGDPQPPVRPGTTQGAYLGRAWKPFSRVVIMQSSISNIIRPDGWLSKGNDPVDKLYFGEFQNTGPGAALGGRVNWPGYHKMTPGDAALFTVAKFIDGGSWLPTTGIPFQDVELDEAIDTQMGAYSST